MNVIRSCMRTFILNKGYKSINIEGRRYYKRWFAPTQIEITRRKRALPPQPVPKRNDFIEWNRSAELYAFNQRLSEKFETTLLEQAFTCRSYIIQEEENQRKMGIADPAINMSDNRELIEKGARFVSEVIEKYLIQELPNVPEEGIIAFHDYLMSNEVLAKAASLIGATDLILTKEHPVAEETLVNVFLALIAALFESSNANHTAIFVRDFLITFLAEKELLSIWCPKKPLQQLNDILSKDGKNPAEPRLIGQAGMNTILAAFHVGMYSDKELLGLGCGQNISEAIEVAATHALCKMYGLLDSSRPINFSRTIEMES